MSDKENAVQQAQQWAQEARTQRATVLSILRYFGLPEHDYEALHLIRRHLEGTHARCPTCGANAKWPNLDALQLQEKPFTGGVATVAPSHGVALAASTEFKEAKHAIMEVLSEQDVRALAIAQFIQLKFHEKYGDAMNNACDALKTEQAHVSGVQEDQRG